MLYHHCTKQSCKMRLTNFLYSAKGGDLACLPQLANSVDCLSGYLLLTIDDAIANFMSEIVAFHYLQSQDHAEKYLLERWTETEKELMRERGLWGPPVGSQLDKWMLDMTEGPCRMRKKMMKNEMFYINYPYKPGIEDSLVRKKFLYCIMTCVIICNIAQVLNYF